jgi:hypothetical protein
LNHISPAEIEALVIDPQASPSAETRRHLAACPECARRLADEASLELALLQVATAGSLQVRSPRLVREPLLTPPWRVSLTAAAVLALLVAGVAFLTRTSERSPQPGLALPAAVEPCRQDPFALSPGYSVHAPLPPCASPDATTPFRMD